MICCDIMTASAGSQVTSIRDLVDQAARTLPEAPFLISPKTRRTLTFQSLQQQLRSLTAQLQQAGLERGDKVAFLMDNGLFSAQLFLGAMYGGFVSVPLNVRAGVSQLSYMLDHCDAKVVFVGNAYEDLAKEAMSGVRRAVRLIPADVDRFLEFHETTAPPVLLPLGREDEALLMYTSGSVGQPKAAVHTHRSVLAQARNSVLSHQLSSSDRSLLVLPLYHINAECVTLVPTLLSGGSVVVPHRFSVSQFWDWLDEYRCTWSAVVPTIISQLLDWKDPAGGPPRSSALRESVSCASSSAPLSPSLHREFLDKFDLLLIQAMGSSEAGNIFSNPLPPGENKIGSPGLAWGFETRIVNREGVDVHARGVRRSAHSRRGYDAGLLQGTRRDCGGAGCRRLAAYRRPRVPGRGRLLLCGRQIEGTDHQRAESTLLHARSTTCWNPIRRCSKRPR